MRKASLLLVGILVLLLVSSCGKKPKPPKEPTPPVVTEKETPPPPPEIPKEEVFQIKQEDLKPIYFDFDKYDLRTGDREVLNKNAMVLKDFSSAKIRIEGNCDERGTVEYNLALGEKRARAAKDYLVNLGIDAGRISIITYGKERASRCQAESCWSKDRRDDFIITSK